MAELQPEVKDPLDSASGAEPGEVCSALTCRLCASEKSDCVDIFGDSESSAGLSESAEMCLPILVNPTFATPCLFTCSQSGSWKKKQKIFRRRLF